MRSRKMKIAMTMPALLGAGFMLTAPVAAAAQEITFESDLPRTLVFITEEGRGQVASREMSAFLRDAGFTVIDPALAHEAAQRELVAAAMAGDHGAAVNLGRDFGAQVLVLGSAEYGTRPTSDGLVTATTEVAIRALRLDYGDVVSEAVADARVLEATEQAARNKAVRQATQEILSTTPLMGRLMNDWEARPWADAEYWRPDPGSFQQANAPASESSGQGPGVAVLNADVLPAEGVATRGLGVVLRAQGNTNVENTVVLEGVVVGETQDVEVHGAQALLAPLSPEEARQYGIEDGLPAQLFRREFTLPVSQDSVRIVARSPGGATTEALAAPRIDKRWAVVIGVGQYQSSDIPDLEFAPADARAVYDFLTSDAAGPFDDVLFLENEQATGAAMREALFVFLQDADWDDLVVIYYAGHGAPDPNRPDNLYLLPTDADLNALAATGFPMWDVKTALRRQIASERVLVIADACHSAGTADEGVGGVDSNPIAGGFANLYSPSRRLMMTAADTDEYSLEDERWGGHGVFTHFLLDGLRGSADRDANGVVTFLELFDHVSNNVRQATNGRQNPQRSGFGDIPLAVVGAGGS